jgi:hypothetical protein
MFRRIADLCASALDRPVYTITLARLSILAAGATMPETDADRAIREQGEWLRQVFPQVDFDDPERHVRDQRPIGDRGTTKPSMWPFHNELTRNVPSWLNGRTLLSLLFGAAIGTIAFALSVIFDLI